MPSDKKNYGFQPSQIIEDEHYILGDGFFQAQILMPDGHGWGIFLPVNEIQARNGFESMNCTNYGTLHALATLGKRLFGTQFQTQLSERYTGVMTGTTQNGNDPHKVIELIRTTCGVVPEVYLPFDASVASWNQYYHPNPMTWTLYSMGAHWLKKYKVGHDWVWVTGETTSSKIVKIKEALKYSPLGVSVDAWHQRDDGIYYRINLYDDHWVCLYDYVEGQYWMIFDSYDNTHKKLDWNFNFGQGKRYSLSLVKPLGSQNEGLEGITAWPYIVYRIKQYFNDILR